MSEPAAGGASEPPAGALVLAGGRSSRMGRPKADLDWHGIPLVVHVAATLRAAVAGPVLVVRAPGQELPALPDGVAVVEDPREGRGPLQGIAVGLAALGDRGTPAAVAVATDQPFAGERLVRRLLDALEPADDAVAIRLDDRLQPLGAAYRTALAEQATARLDAGRSSLQGLLAAVRTRVLDGTAADAAALRSLDTPEAYAAALRLRA